MTQNVASLFGGPTGQREANQNCVATLEKWLEMAKAGEIVGVVMAGLTHDRCGTWQAAGFVGGYSILGALVDAQAATLETVRSG